VTQEEKKQSEGSTRRLLFGNIGDIVGCVRGVAVKVWSVISFLLRGLISKI